MEEYSKYIFLAIAAAFSIYRSFQKKKKAELSQEVLTQDEEFETETESESSTQPIEDSHLLQNERKRMVSNSIERAKPIARTSEKKSISNSEIDDQTEADEFEELEDFDLRKAVIYSEILKPPYL